LKKYGHLSTSESIASSAVKTAIDVNAKAIIVCSETGATARQVAKFRPGMKVIVITTSAFTARQCFGVIKGCQCKLLNDIDETDSTIVSLIEEFKRKELASSGDPFVIVHGTKKERGSTNTMQIIYA